MADRIDLVVRNTDRAISLTPGQVLIAGRTVQCDLHLDDPSVSRRHCSMAVDNGLVRVRDLQSANGTFINERQITDATARPGDLIRLGAAIIEVRDPTGIAQRLDETYFVEDATVESVIQRRIETTPRRPSWRCSSARNGICRRCTASANVSPVPATSSDSPTPRFAQFSKWFRQIAARSCCAARTMRRARKCWPRAPGRTQRNASR
jgi:predicted component of type VI protein secretion system